MRQIPSDFKACKQCFEAWCSAIWVCY
jgi:hypothetical protein